MAFVKRPRQRRKTKNVQQQITKVKSDVGKVKRAVFKNKFIDLAVGIIPTANLAQTTQLFTIPQGNNEGEREGMNIKLTRMHFKFQINLPSTTTVADSTDMLRMILWKDKQTNRAIPSGVSTILTTSTNGINHHYNMDRLTSRNVVLWDRTFTLNSSSGAGSTTTYAPITRFVELKKNMNIPIKYNNSVTTGAIASIESNNVYLSTVTLNANATVDMDLRVFYVDTKS